MNLTMEKVVGGKETNKTEIRILDIVIWVCIIGWMLYGLYFVIGMLINVWLS